MKKAQDELDKNRPDKAIDRYKKAWKHTQQSMKDDFDDNNEDD